MTSRLHMTLAGVLFVCFSLPFACQGGQVVTKELRAWAQHAVRQEKELHVQSSDTRTLAVLYFHNQTGWEKLRLLQKGLAVMLITDLSKVKEIQLVERAKIQALVEELGFGVSGLVAPDSAPRVARLLGASLFVGGDIVREKPDAFALKSGLLSVSTEKALGNPTVRGKLLEGLFGMEKDLLFKIIRLLKIQLTPELEAELREPSTESLEALLDLFRGIEKGDQGDYDDANDLLDKALNEDPGFDLPADTKKEIARIFPSDTGTGGSDSGGISDGGFTRKKKECAALRNKLRRSSFRRRRF